MSDWWLDLVGTFVGALLALISGWWLRRRQQRRDELRLLQNLIDGLHRKRALTLVVVAADVSPEGDPDDRQRCLESVLDVRRRIAEAADRLLVGRDARPHLADMRTACNRWLSVETRRSERLEAHLVGWSHPSHAHDDGERRWTTTTPRRAPAMGRQFIAPVGRCGPR